MLFTAQINDLFSISYDRRTDSRTSKLLVNQLCMEGISWGAREEPFYQCFVAAMPDEASDVEVSTGADAEAIAYSDRPVAVEPGLSLDVLPLRHMLPGPH